MAYPGITVLRSSVPPHGDADASPVVPGIGHLIDQFTVNIGR